jgi:hypothetical protein
MGVRAEVDFQPVQDLAPHTSLQTDAELAARPVP